ncbi:MAG: dUTP diphosphatase [Spirochaetae bacterium HGW-Spirochaetae-8]|jgi:dUTP pyrophosphatase|nr:MAG: dUTP diphosphatase [Spirochaetae bacterium HGW-Spirochaetae-8]
MDSTAGMEIRIVVNEGAILPRFATPHAAGADLCAFLPRGAVILQPRSFELIPTGLIMEIPVGFEGQVRPRSGLAAKFGVTVLNAPGTIDSDYRGEVKIILINHGDKPFTINHGDRIAQLVICTTQGCRFIQADSISSTERGERGFGSTGV